MPGAHEVHAFCDGSVNEPAGHSPVAPKEDTRQLSRHQACSAEPHNHLHPVPHGQASGLFSWPILSAAALIDACRCRSVLWQQSSALCKATRCRGACETS